MEPLNEREVDLLVTNPKRLVGDVVWHPLARNDRATLSVGNTQGQSLQLRLRIAHAAPDRLHAMLMRGHQTLRRLDVRDDHANPDGTTWAGATHKHRWTDRHGDAEAYTPTDIPEPDGAVTPSDYRRIVEAFCHECNIDTSGLTWTEPTLGKEKS